MTIARKLDELSPGFLQSLSVIVSSITGVQLGSAQEKMVESRIARRILDLGLEGPAEYESYFSSNRSSETSALVSLLTTHHTYFFREPAHFEYLEREGLRLAAEAARKDGRTEIRVWSAACSYGQEVYSLAMFLRHHLPLIAPGMSFKIQGTDVDPAAVDIAKNGVYRSDQLESVPPKYLEGNWVKGSGEISAYVRARAPLRESCEFATANLLDLGRKATGKFDIIFCRNVFIYFTSDRVRDITRELLRALSPGGRLFLGISESVAGLDLPISLHGPSIYGHQDQAPLPEPSRSTSGARAEAKAPIAPASTPRTRILIVDDSPTIRKMLTRFLEREPSFEVVAATGDPRETEALILKHRPDVVTLDIHMPEMNGVEVLRELRPKYRLPMIMITSAAIEEGGLVIEALESGAFDYIQKPSFENLPEVAPLMIEKVKAAAMARLSTRPSLEMPVPIRPTARRAAIDGTIFAIGSSTGGTEALKEILTRLPANIPPTVIVQHIPAGFSKALAARLDSLCPFEVKEASDGDELKPGLVLIAPGGRQMSVVRHARGALYVKVTDGEPVNRHKPSVDVLFGSLAEIQLRNPIGVVLTGMGNDGAAGLLEMKEAGARTIAQSEASCVVFGMPKAAIATGGVDTVLDLALIPEELLRLMNTPRT